MLRPVSTLTHLSLYLLSSPLFRSLENSPACADAFVEPATQLALVEACEKRKLIKLQQKTRIVNDIWLNIQLTTSALELSLEVPYLNADVTQVHLSRVVSNSVYFNLLFASVF